MNRLHDGSQPGETTHPGGLATHTDLAAVLCRCRPRRKQLNRADRRRLKITTVGEIILHTDACPLANASGGRTWQVAGQVRAGMFGGDR